MLVQSFCRVLDNLLFVVLVTSFGIQNKTEDIEIRVELNVSNGLAELTNGTYIRMDWLCHTEPNLIHNLL
jgi:hypothetical protein